jgi:NADP-dependent 3-hydroxy acid dehydrogenase YdfG
VPRDQSHRNYQNKSKKVALVTRAANDIGKANIIEFGRAGYTIMINDTSEQELKQAAREILNSLSQYGGAHISTSHYLIPKQQRHSKFIKQIIM